MIFFYLQELHLLSAVSLCHLYMPYVLSQFGQIQVGFYAKAGELKFLTHRACPAKIESCPHVLTSRTGIEYTKLMAEGRLFYMKNFGTGEGCLAPESKSAI